MLHATTVNHVLLLILRSRSLPYFVGKTTKRNPKIEQCRNLGNFYETEWSKQSVKTDNRARKKYLN